MSPVIVVAARRFEDPRKFGPPESPKHVPPSSWDAFCEIFSQVPVSVFSVPA